MILEQTLVIQPLYKNTEETKREIETEARMRKIENTTIVTANFLRRTVQVTTDSIEFINFLRSNKSYLIRLLMT